MGVFIFVGFSSTKDKNLSAEPDRSGTVFGRTGPKQEGLRSNRTEVEMSSAEPGRLERYFGRTGPKRRVLRPNRTEVRDLIAFRVLESGRFPWKSKSFLAAMRVKHREGHFG